MMKKILTIVVITYFLGSAWYLKYLNSTISILKENNILLVQANKDNIDTLQIVKERFNNIIKVNSDLSDKIIQSNTKIATMEIELQKTIRKLDVVSLRKPTLVERKINDSTDKTIKCLEKTSRGEECDF